MTVGAPRIVLPSPRLQRNDHVLVRARAASVRPASKIVGVLPSIAASLWVIEGRRISLARREDSTPRVRAMLPSARAPEISAPTTPLRPLPLRHSMWRTSAAAGASHHSHPVGSASPWFEGLSRVLPTRATACRESGIAGSAPPTPVLEGRTPPHLAGDRVIAPKDEAR